jgi:vacuolar protein sorting-associated protein 45
MAASADEAGAWGASFKQRPPGEAIVFIIGGSTYEEAKVVAEWNAKQPPGGGLRVVLGGSEVVNCDMVLKALGMGQV